MVPSTYSCLEYPYSTFWQGEYRFQSAN